MIGNVRPDDLEGLRQFKADFFKALAHPMRIRILELLLQAPMSVSQLQEAIGVPASSISQQLAVLRGRTIVVTERRGTTIIYRPRDPELFDLLDVARRMFNAHLEDTIHMLRLVEAEPVGAGQNWGSPTLRRAAHASFTALAVTQGFSTSGFGIGVTDVTLGAFPESGSVAAHAKNAYQNAVFGYHEAGGMGVRGLVNGENGIGVSGEADDTGGVGLRGTADGSNGVAVYGSASSGTGVVGMSGEFGGGTAGAYGIGVPGISSSLIGVAGEGARGGVFLGASAQVQLLPGPRATHRAKGRRGDLYVDKTGRLSFCKTGGTHSIWHQLA